ncbi:DUF1996 domain-containing protein [Spirillospora albida]|uniref:DUF1996 domain-containing protein n=1 Tax=Spirillospora albida TaxID=58123 RepID=UPI0004BF4F0E|nr:DUF1996 domain-containing protein [Spirillospora albida]
MERKRIAFAVLAPALALAVSAAGTTPAGAAAPYLLTAPADPSRPPDGGAPGAPGDGTAPPSQDPGGGQTADPSQPPGDGQTADPSQPPGDGQTADPSQPPDDGQNEGGDAGQEQPPPSVIKPGPTPEQFVSIRRAPRVQVPRSSRRASTGRFTSRCGVNAGQRHSNPDNFIVAPGVQNGAHHIHDYVGNLTADAFSTDESLAASGTTCSNGDKSTYYWPVVRLRDGQDGSERAEQSKADGNVGSIVTPSSARIQFLGNPRGKVVAMPRFLRVIMGDAKAGTNGLANAKASWGCSGVPGRAFTDKYPLCPRGSQVTRTLTFPSCWDGQNTDSANHRTHIVFPGANGACPQGTRAVPQLRLTLSYRVPARALAFALDTFPEQGHDPVTDHADFVNVMSEGLMQRAVNCINSGRRC